MPGVRTRGVTPGGRETYAASDLHVIDDVRASWHGRDLGRLAPVDPPVPFGFSSAPRRPSIVSVTTTVHRHQPAVGGPSTRGDSENGACR
jgi:hypothetical protein